MHRLLMVLLLIGLIAGQAGIGAAAYLTDAELNAGNSFHALISSRWVQTTQEDFEAGVFDHVDITSSPGDIKLSLIHNLTLVTSDNAERSARGITPTLVKTLTFTKSGDTYNELRVDSDLRIDREVGNKIAYCDIHVNGVSVFTHSTQSADYVSYQDTLDFSGYAYGPHTIELYLYTDNRARTAFNSVLELYRTHTYAAAGTVASQVFDTEIPGAEWDALFWDETLPANTDITFEVRASDTAFTKDAETPSWASAGGASPVTSELPSGRYLQWRATLTTSDTSETPTLHEVTVEYY